jgi:hypothetical protein
VCRRLTAGKPTIYEVPEFLWVTSNSSGQFHQAVSKRNAPSRYSILTDWKRAFSIGQIQLSDTQLLALTRQAATLPDTSGQQEA